ncbi:MAG TPA: helix-turn-helix domain-containing protein [Streptosporangiaceae bacterium]|jgi:AcrR family transcriptional regulator
MDASVVLLGRQPGASVDEIARAAGVSRQTIYAHYPSRDALLEAVTQHVSAEVTRELSGLDLDRGHAIDALGRWVDTGWALMTRYPVLLTSAIVAPEGDDERERHEPVMGGLLRLIERGRRRREFDPAMPASWYLAAIIGLGHAAGDEVTAGRMTRAKAGAAFRESVLRVCRAPL